MPTLSFDGETHGEIVAKVKRWLASLDGEERPLTPAEVVAASAELTKDALRIVAAAAPAPIAQSDLAKGLTALGYQATDTTARAAVEALDALSQATGGSLVQKAQQTAASAVYEMNATVAKQVLKVLLPRKP